MRRSQGKTRSSHQRAMSGKESSRSVSPVGAQSTITTSNSPDSWWRLIWSRLNSSSMPAAPSAPRPRCPSPRGRRAAAEPALHRAPVRLHLALGLDLLAPEPVGDRGRIGPELVLERIGQAVGRIGGQDDRPQALGAQRRAVAAATLVLPTPPLPV